VRGIGFVAMLYACALCCVSVASIELYSIFQFWKDGREAVIESVDPMVGRYVKHQLTGLAAIDVWYVTADGRLAVPDKILGPVEIEQLAARLPVRIVFLPNDPKRVESVTNRTKVPWIWLIAAAILVGLAMFAHFLLRKEAGR
jgi:hypothetical protein